MSQFNTRINLALNSLVETTPFSPEQTTTLRTAQSAEEIHRAIEADDSGAFGVNLRRALTEEEFFPFRRSLADSAAGLRAIVGTEVGHRAALHEAAIRRHSGSSRTEPPRVALVTGGTGFIGRNLIRALVAEGWEVKSLARGFSEELAQLDVEQIQGSITDPDVLRRATQGCNVCFHTAASAGASEKLDVMEEINVGGTERVVQAALESSISVLVYTSSSAVVYGGQPHDGTDENTPYPSQYLSPYGRQKAEAEKRVLEANGQPNSTGRPLSVVSLRLTQVLGPENTRFFDSITKVAQGGTKIIGEGDNLWDWTYIDDAVQAHLRAAAQLLKGAEIGGKSYFVSSGDPVPYGRLMNAMLGVVGQEPMASTSLADALAFADAEEAKARATPGYKPRLRRSVIEKLRNPQWHRIDAARRDLGYEPTVTFGEATRKLLSHFSRDTSGLSTDLPKEVPSVLGRLYANGHLSREQLALWSDAMRHLRETRTPFSSVLLGAILTLTEKVEIELFGVIVELSG